MASAEDESENINQMTIGQAANLQYEQEMMDENIAYNGTGNDDIGLGDPNPPNNNASTEDKIAYAYDVKIYSAEMLECLKKANVTGKELWVEFTCTFRESSIKVMTAAQHVAWSRFLRENGVFVEQKRGLARWKTLRNCLLAEHFIPFHGSSPPQVLNDEIDSSRELGENNVQDGYDKTNVNRNTLPASNEKPVTLKNTVSLSDTVPTYGKGSNSSGSLATEGKNGRNRNGIDSLMKAYAHRTKFAGSFTDDFDGAIEQYETLAALCDLSEEDMSKGFPIMLTGSAFSHYTRNYAKKFLRYPELVDEFRAWYTSEEQRYRLLQSWQRPSLLRSMEKEPEKSELEVFRNVTDQLTKIQHQLHRSYHDPRFLRDQLLIAADLPHLRRSLIEKIPKTAQEAMQRIATLLSSEPKSAGANCIHEDRDEINYGLGNRYGGQARKSLKGSSFKRNKNNSRTSLASIKGCWVCGKPHRARDHHPSEDVIKALNDIKKKKPSVLFTVEDIDEIQAVYMSISDDVDSDSDSSKSEANIIDETSDENIGQMHEIYLANKSFLHGISCRTFQSDLAHRMDVMHSLLLAGESYSNFKGVILDTGANRRSAMCLNQYRAYCSEFMVPMRIDYSDRHSIVGIGGSTAVIGTAIVPIPFADLNIIIDVKFKILRDNCPTLLSLKDMIENGLDISIQDKTISFKHNIQSLTFENDFLKHKWSPKDTSYALYTERELRRLHRVFGHPTVTALGKLLRNANPNEFTAEVRKSIEQITNMCNTCKRFSSKPRRFKISVGSNDLRFNHIVAIDIMMLAGKHVLHAVDEATHYTAATFMRNNTAEETWKSLLRCWSRVYLGPPDYLRIDQGSNFVAKHFRDSADADGISILEAPIECPNTMSHVERYHAPLRAAYNKIRDALPRSENDTECLQLAVKAVNDTIGPEGLCPTVLVYGTLPRPPRRTPADTQIQRAKTLDLAMDAVLKEQSKRRIAFALRHPSSPKAQEQEEQLSLLPSGAPVLVYRQGTKKWEGPYPLVHISGRTVVVQLPHGRKIFRSNVVKSANSSENRETWCDMNCMQYAYNISDNYLEFSSSRRSELNGLQARGTFEIVPISSVPPRTRIYGSRWVDTVKEVNGMTVKKSRLVAQNFRDKGATEIATKSPTVSRMGQRIAIATAAMFPHHKSYVRDISQAYIQSESNLERMIYIKPPEEMNLSHSEILLVKKPLYGIPESGLHWFATYQSHHIEKLGMEASKGDVCVLYKNDDSRLMGVTILQVDDSFGHGTAEFLEKEEAESKRFQCKPRKLLSPGDSALFNGCNISMDRDGAYAISQSEKLRKMLPPTNQEDLISTRAKIQYIGSCTRPDLCSPVQLMASNVCNPSEKTFKDMEKITNWCRETAGVGIKYVPLDTESIRLSLFTDASFANADKLKSQLGFVLVISDHNGNANILHYGSTTCKRVARSVMAAELQGLVYGFDQAYVVREILSDIIGRKVDLDAYVDSRTVFNVVAKSSMTLEKRLQIDVHAIRESHKKGELRYLAWIPSYENISDGLTKGLIDSSHSLWKLMVTNKLSLQPSGWVESKTDNN